MRKMIFGAASLLALASPAVAADLTVTPYGSYQEEYAYRTAPPVVVEEPPAVVIRRPVVVAPPVVVDEYPVYAAPPVYAYAGPVWRHGWGYRRGYFHGGW